jgi:hypothetical protein
VSQCTTLGLAVTWHGQVVAQDSIEGRFRFDERAAVVSSMDRHNQVLLAYSGQQSEAICKLLVNGSVSREFHEGGSIASTGESMPLDLDLFVLPVFLSVYRLA